MLLRLNCNRSYVRGETDLHICMVGGYTEDFAKSQSCQNWELADCTEMNTYSGQYDTYKKDTQVHKAHWKISSVQHYVQVNKFMSCVNNVTTQCTDPAG